MRLSGKALWLLGVALLGSHPAAADTLVDHVRGRRLDAQGNVERFTGMVITPEGRVARLLHKGEERPARPDFVLDGHDAALIPGRVLSPLRLMPLALDSIAPPRAKRPLPPPRPEDRDLALATIQPSLFALGVTAVADMGTTIEDWQTYRRAGDLGRLNVRIVGFADSIANMVLIAGSGPTPWLYNDRLRLNGLLVETMLVETGGTPKPSIIKIKNQISRAGMDHFQVVLRVDPKAASREAELAAAVKELSETYQGDRRWQIVPIPDQTSLPLAAGISRQELVTYAPSVAHGLFAESRFGSLAQGQWADFVLLDSDPFEDKAPSPRPLSTWIAGRMVWQANNQAAP